MSSYPSKRLAINQFLRHFSSAYDGRIDFSENKNCRLFDHIYNKTYSSQDHDI